MLSILPSHAETGMRRAVNRLLFAFIMLVLALGPANDVCLAIVSEIPIETNEEDDVGTQEIVLRIHECHQHRRQSRSARTDPDWAGRGHVAQQIEHHGRSFDTVIPVGLSILQTPLRC